MMYLIDLIISTIRSSPLLMMFRKEAMLQLRSWCSSFLFVTFYGFALRHVSVLSTKTSLRCVAPSVMRQFDVCIRSAAILQSLTKLNWKR
jgi:hypothetical protein